MRKSFLFLFLVDILITFLTGCRQDELPKSMELAESRAESVQNDPRVQHSSYLIWLDGSGCKSLAEQIQSVNHYDSLLAFSQLPGPDQVNSLLTIARDSLNDVTVVGNVKQFVAGTYSPDLIQELRHLRRGVVLIADNDNSEQLKSWMLRLLGMYVGKGYYKVSYPNEQRYYYYDMADPNALKKLCGTNGLPADSRTLAWGAPTTDDTSDPEVTKRAMRAMKRIYLSNRFYVYTNRYDYPMTGYELLPPYSGEVRKYSPASDKLWDAAVDREWAIDAYNLRIYAPTNGDNMLAVYSAGGNGFANKIQNSTVFVKNPPKNEVWGLLWGLRNNAYTRIRISDGQSSLLNLSSIDFAPGLPQDESTISHSQSRSVGFDLSMKPELKGEYRWGKSITYQLKEMTRVVNKTQTDSELSYSWKWYPETLFRGSRAMKDDNMIDGSAMISPAWYDILYNAVTPVSKNVFCDYDTDPLFNQNLLNYQQECAVTMKTDGASAGIVAVEIVDGMNLQRGGVWFNSWGTPTAHPLPNDSGVACDALLDVSAKLTVWIDFNNW